MSLNDTPNAERAYIGIFGNRNAGKSSLINAITNQTTAVVSDVPGTTTDPVSKTMELLPLGPVVLVDTPGYDDEGLLGAKRVATTKRTLGKTDIALLVVDCIVGETDTDRALKQMVEELDIPYIIVYNKADKLDVVPDAVDGVIYVSALAGHGINELKDMIGSYNDRIKKPDVRLVADFINPGDYIMLVIPVDSGAPKGRIILPQQQAIRDILDADGRVVAVKEDQVKQTIESMPVKPAIVITDSQVFARVSKDVPEDIRLTSFSILMARYKGFIDIALKGTAVLDELKAGDKVLISEGCTHHRQCEDIGTVKLPALIRKHCGEGIEFSFSSGGEFPEDMSEYKLVIHCGGCMLSSGEMRRRMRLVDRMGIPVTNYGLAIAHMNGILKRSTEILYLL